MNREKQLRLSLFTVPDLSIGRAPLTPQNSQFDPRRLNYLEGMVAYLNGLFEDLRKNYGQSEAGSRLEKLLAQLPYSELAKIDSSGNPVVTEIPTARDRIAFNQERLRINLLDGLHRRPESAGIPARRYSPVVSHIISKLSRGISEKALARILVESDVNLSSVIGSLRDLEMIEEIDPSAPIVPESLLEGQKDRLTWLGHACLLFQTSRSSVCVDPFLRPHIKWTEKDLTSSFSDSFGDRFFFEPYGPQLTQLSPAQLPPLDAVFVTHQDIDHCSLGVLMMLPEDIPIVVPECQRAHPWEVDLAALIPDILGRRRKVIRLKHGETITIGDIRATAFPFVAEMPSSLKTSWNCYLFETDHAAVACTADSAVTDESIDFLSERLHDKRRVFVLCARLVHSGEKSPGFRDEADNLFNFTRLWAWYMPIWDLFQPVEVSGISEERLRTLSQRTDLRFYLPYAMGTAPWYRIADVKDPLHVPMANLSAEDLDALSGTLKAISSGPILFPGKFAQPVCLAEA
jgi:L-ascorbate metabolism protein UlaG (beta-lactamase superfamily)